VFLAVVCATLDDRAVLPPLLRTAVIVLPIEAVSFLAIALLSYMYWTPVGATFIDGIHGRYLIPLTPAVLMLICSAIRKLRKVKIGLKSEWINGLIAAISVCASAYFLAVVWNRYYG
jgi:uncharacterized membrane protein